MCGPDDSEPLQRAILIQVRVRPWGHKKKTSQESHDSGSMGKRPPQEAELLCYKWIIRAEQT